MEHFITACPNLRYEISGSKHELYIFCKESVENDTSRFLKIQSPAENRWFNCNTFLVANDSEAQDKATFCNGCPKCPKLEETHEEYTKRMEGLEE